jgi:anti-anti-sigma factor
MTVHELQVSVSREGGGGVIALAGELNASARQALDEAYAEATAQDPDHVVLDFSRADYINSTGIAVIVGLLAQARAQAIEIRARGLSDHYREIFELTRLDDAVGIHTSEDAALAAL